MSYALTPGVFDLRNRMSDRRSDWQSEAQRDVQLRRVAHERTAEHKVGIECVVVSGIREQMDAVHEIRRLLKAYTLHPDVRRRAHEARCKNRELHTAGVAADAAQQRVDRFHASSQELLERWRKRHQCSQLLEVVRVTGTSVVRLQLA